MRGKKLLAAFLLVLVIGMSGCSADRVRLVNRRNSMKLSIGMARGEVLNIMGTKTIHTLGIPSAINNPYRSEVLYGKNGKTLEVLYYYTDIQRRNGAITDDELTPLVFDDDILIGWGRGFLQENIQKYEIRIR